MIDIHNRASNIWTKYCSEIIEIINYFLLLDVYVAFQKSAHHILEPHLTSLTKFKWFLLCQSKHFIIKLVCYFLFGMSIVKNLARYLNSAVNVASLKVMHS